MGNQYDILSKEYILANIGQEDIFERYLGIYPNTNQRYTNPLRDDDSAGCKFYWDDRGMLKFKDFAAGFNWDCFNIVQMREGNNCSFKKAMIIIAEDFGLIDNPNTNRSVMTTYIPTKKKLSVPIRYRVSRKAYRKEDLAYWEDYGVDKEVLDYYSVSVAKQVWKEKHGIKILMYTYSSPKDPCFIYHFGGYDYKLYYPARKKGQKHMHLDQTIVQGYNQLPEYGEVLVITKSLKDVIVLYTFGIPSIAPMSETSYIGIDNNMDELKQRFENIFVLYDRDTAGITGARYLKENHNLRVLFLRSDEPKDISDVRKELGLQYTLDLIEDAKYQLL